MKSSPNNMRTNAVLLTVPGQLPPAGGTIRAEPYGVTVTFRPGALVRPTAVALAVTARQFPSVARSDYVVSAHGVSLTFDATCLSRRPEIDIELAFAGDFDPERTFLCISDTAGVTAVISAQRSADGRYLLGTIPAWYLVLHRSKATQRGAATSLFVYTATKLLAEPSVLVTSVQEFNPATGLWAGLTTNLANLRVAVLVHGILSSLDYLAILATDIGSYTRPGDTRPYYDLVIGFQYTSNAALATIGDVMADSVSPLIAPAGAVDLFAHSMGNLVSRWAMEVGNATTGNRLTHIGHYVSLGGPHAGVPFADSLLIDSFLYLFPLPCDPCLNDLLTYGDNGAPKTDFLTKLNGATQATGTRYYTISGRLWLDYEYGVGVVTRNLYMEADPENWDFWVEDGLVARFSAQSAILEAKDPQWQPGPTLDLNHHQLTEDTQSITSIYLIIDDW